MNLDDLPPTPGVYLLTHRVTGDTYVGKSAQMRYRVAAHIKKMNCGTHPNRGIFDLCKKAGADFSVSVLEICDRRRLAEAEVEWARKISPTLNRASVRAKGFETVAFSHKDSKSPGDRVTWIGLMTRADRARFKYFCERNGLEMEEVGARWIMERLAQEESSKPKPPRPR